MQSFKAMVLALLLAAVLPASAGAGVTNKNSRTGPFILGAEVSWTQEDEADGAEYFDHGVKKDIFDILADRKFNFIRLRLFVNPGATNGYAANKSEAFCDLEHVKKLATRAKAHGMGLLLDIHYGDTWTSPGKQAKPGAWRDLSFAELTNAVHDFTRNAVTALRDNGTQPELVQIGNEISDGLLFPDGSRSKPENFAALVGAGCRAVREVDPNIKVVLHHHLGRDNSRMRPWLDNFIQHGVDFDLIGMSCYAQAQEGDWQRNFDDLATRYPNHGLLVVEYSGRKRFINELMFNTPNAKGWGAFIWEAARHREAIFDRNGANAGGGQHANFKSQETNAPAATNVVAKAEPENHGGRYDVNALADLYPQMAKDFVGIAPPRPTSATVWLDELNLKAASQGWGEPRKNLTVDGKPLTLGGKFFARGFGTHSVSELRVKLGGEAKSFSASVGVDDEAIGAQKGSVIFSVIGDGRVLWTSGVMKPGDAAKRCDVKLDGVQSVTLQVGDAGDGIEFDHADWADAQFVTAPAARLVVGEALPVVAPYILTPPAPATPRINGPNVFGVRPGSPFLYTIPATGERPMAFSAAKLPRGLKLDSASGIITGSLKSKGEFNVTLRAKNKLGIAEKKFRIVCGDQLALTPPMGWNSWNCFASAVSAEKVKAAADAFVKAGLINHGWSYINIDDFWQNHRNSKDATLRGEFRKADGEIQPNSRFPDMKGLADHIHALGLKAGLYSSPGPWTCGGCTGSWEHEAQDAATYAAWGFDYLKYDWCSYGGIASGKMTNMASVPLWGQTATNREGAIYPYRLMGDFLRTQKRDIVFSLCQYGMADVWQWGAEVGGQCWRTTGDITDTWRSMSGIGFKQDKAAPYAGPGHWNDPDMLIVGWVGWGPKLHPTRLTPDEQYTHISLWCLLAAPLLIGCDLEKLDDFTLSLLTNDEVLAVDQDALGRQATCVSADNNLRVYAKDLEDGGKAVGLFNLGDTPAKVVANWNDLKLSGPQTVRDLWRQQDLGKFEKEFSATVAPHGVVLVKITN